MTTIRKDGTDAIELNMVKKGQGDPLIFIHGWAASHRFWKHQVPFFAQSNQVISYDLRGHGDSGKPETGYQITDHLHDLEKLLTENRLSKLVLIGHSLGGMIALQYALEHPLTPRALVLVGTSPHPVASRKRSIQFSFLQLLIRMSRKRAANFTERALFAPNVRPELVEWVNKESMRTPTHVILEILKSVKSFNIVSQLSEIQAPTLIVYSEFETAVESQALNQMQELIPKAKLQMISGAGHNCMLEQPSQFNSVLDGFLRELKE